MLTFITPGLTCIAHWFRAAKRNVSGQITVSMALIALPLSLAVGSALDYGMLVRAKSGLQLALDSATLAAAAKQGNLQPELARGYFALNGTLEGVTISSIDFQKQKDGTVQGTVTATVPAVFARILRRKDYTVHVTSSAKGVFAQDNLDMKLTADFAQGIYDKEIYYFAREPDGQIKTSALALRYDYRSQYDSVAKRWLNWSGRPADAKLFQWEGRFAAIGLAMVVYVDNSGRGERINPYVILSDTPNAVYFMKRSGYCDNPQGMKIYWEETGDRFGDYRDFVTTFTCAFSRIGVTNVRLVN